MNNYERSFDGVVVAGQYIHEREVTNRTTLHHEIGHWLGLRHVFAANQGDSLTCLSKPDNDELPDTQQFPYHQETMFDRYQKPCESEEEVLVTNIMSVRILLHLAISRSPRTVFYSWRCGRGRVQNRSESEGLQGLHGHTSWLEQSSRLRPCTDSRTETRAA